MIVEPLRPYPALYHQAASLIFEHSPCATFLQKKYLTLKRWESFFREDHSLIDNSAIILDRQNIAAIISFDQNTLLGPAFKKELHPKTALDTLWQIALQQAAEKKYPHLNIYTEARFWPIFEQKGFLLLELKPFYHGFIQFLENAHHYCETEHFYFRLLHAEDQAALIALHGEPLVQRYQNGPKKAETTLQRLSEWRIHAYRHGFGNWALCDKKTGAFVGGAGIFHYLMEEDRDEYEIAYSLMPEYWGKGYGLEIVQGLIAFGRAHFPGKALWAMTRPGNAVSRHLLEKVGFRLDRIDIHQAGPACFYHLVL